MAEEIKDVVVEEIVEELEVVEELVEEEEEVVLPTFVMVGNKKYELSKTGAGQAQQVSDLLNWLGKYGDELALALVSDDDGEEIDTEASQLSGVWKLVAAVGKVSSKDALIDLFVVVVGCTKKEADKYFTIGILIDGVQVLLSQEEYGKVLNRFF